MVSTKIYCFPVACSDERSAAGTTTGTIFTVWFDILLKKEIGVNKERPNDVQVHKTNITYCFNQTFTT